MTAQHVHFSIVSATFFAAFATVIHYQGSRRIELSSLHIPPTRQRPDADNVQCGSECAFHVGLNMAQEYAADMAGS